MDNGPTDAVERRSGEAAQSIGALVWQMDKLIIACVKRSWQA